MTKVLNVNFALKNYEYNEYIAFLKVTTGTTF